ncbi:RNA polymerase RpoN-/SigL-like sigma 54 subunit [Rhodovulum imhoffii]|uniref:RNA polymerase sigma-54 factor n=1 Tax=Rhodovulum imhoffii TaxID=365340 RepID=A0A2T5BP98_9RHOB|nr:hypothetical protein [Rhodovulum imhoffii]MBK5932914.1 hypothetical protein [Rhodovulum imhoffii]PTN00850.1 RNA polymerase RpoN-/SigL-like sigma 54 subunit [Rhodovulum imhoffii]
MSLNQGLHVRQSQRLALSAGVRVGLSLLCLPIVELADELQALADKNPLLDYVPPEGGGLGQAEALAAPISLADRLCEQIGLMTLPPRVAALAKYLAGDLDERGFLGSTAAELAETLDLAEEEVARAIAVLQACEPAGVAARDLRECFVLQLAALGVNADLARRAGPHLGALAEGRLAGLPAKLGASAAEIAEILRLLPGLTPSPAANMGDAPPPALADLLVEEDGASGFVVTLNSRDSPSLRVDSALMKELSRLRNISPELRVQRTQAEDLIRAQTFRGETLLRVGREIVTAQQGFFAEGAAHMVPLTRVVLAQRLNLHPTTVGRALSGKALSFRGAVYALAAFVPAALPQSDGSVLSAYAVKRRIQTLVAGEDRRKTLSDGALVALLAAEGVDISRRTVAKYRQGMGIPPAFERRRIKAAQAKIRIDFEGRKG